MVQTVVVVVDYKEAVRVALDAAVDVALLLSLNVHGQGGH